MSHSTTQVHTDSPSGQVVASGDPHLSPFLTNFCGSHGLIRPVRDCGEPCYYSGSVTPVYVLRSAPENFWLVEPP